MTGCRRLLRIASIVAEQEPTLVPCGRRGTPLCPRRPRRRRTKKTASHYFPGSTAAEDPSGPAQASVPAAAARPDPDLAWADPGGASSVASAGRLGAEVAAAAEVPAVSAGREASFSVGPIRAAHRASAASFPAAGAVQEGAADPWASVRAERGLWAVDRRGAGLLGGLLAVAVRLRGRGPFRPRTVVAAAASTWSASASGRGSKTCFSLSRRVGWLTDLSIRPQMVGWRRNLTSKLTWDWN